MNDSPGARKIAFALVAAALLALGAFLLVPGSPGASGAHQTVRSPKARAGGGPSAAPTTVAASTAAPAASPGGVAAGGTVDIYRLVPFSQAELGQAVAAAQRFGADYGSYSYQQDAAQYVAPMRALVTPELAATLERGFAAPGVAAIRLRQKQVAMASATVIALRAFGPSSMTFVVRVDQAIHAAQGSASHLATEYAVTAERVGGGWQIGDIQLASAGNS